MSKTVRNNDAAIIRAAARLITGSAAYDRLVQLAGETQCVLIGEASHGTHEFYETRAELTKRLIQEKGFRAVALEADWPDTFRVHRFVTGRGDDGNANDALSDFRRFPDGCSKLQRSSKSQAPTSLLPWCLMFGASLVLGAWCLELFTIRRFAGVIRSVRASALPQSTPRPLRTP